MKDDANDVVFFDMYNLIYRAYHGNQNKLTNSQGIPTNAIHTTMNMMLNLEDSFSNLKFALCAFDGGATSFRKELDPMYKAHRNPMPEDLSKQMPYIKEAMHLMGWPVLEADSVEADDVIGALAHRAAKKGFNTYIVSSDKDFRSLVRENLFILDTMNKNIYDREKVFEKMGVYPENVIAYLALLGDSADNIPGIDKVGEKTAAKYLNQYVNIEGIRHHVNEIKGVVGQNLKAGFDSGRIDLNLKLITLALDTKIELKSGELLKRPCQMDALIHFCDDLNLNFIKSRITNASIKKIKP